jgi:hypothetical protein
MPFHRVLIALDESAVAAHCVGVGSSLASALNAETALVHVLEPQQLGSDSGIPLAEILAERRRAAREWGPISSSSAHTVAPECLAS